jgi:hypothetical protein
MFVWKYQVVHSNLGPIKSIAAFILRRQFDRRRGRALRLVCDCDVGPVRVGEAAEIGGGHSGVAKFV